MKLARVLGAVNGDHSSGSRYAARCVLSEQLDALISAEADAQVRQRATQLLAELDAADERLFARVRARLARGMYSRAGMIRSLWRHDARTQEAGYSPLDVLLAGMFDAGELPEELPQTSEMVAYQPAPGRVILALLEQVRDDDVFYDLGSGLGRVVLCVSLLTAARARGIEFQPSFCAYARRVAQQVNARAEFHALDARDAQLDDGTLFFLYTPFRGALLRSVLARLRRVAALHAVRVCTFGPCTAEVSSEPWLRLRGASASPDELAIFDSREPADAAPALSRQA